MRARSFERIRVKHGQPVRRRLCWLGVWLAGACVCAAQPKAAPSVELSAITEPVKPLVYSYEIVRRYPHDPQAYTQGLVYHQGFLYEGTGPLNGQRGPGSSIREVDLQSGRVLRARRLEAGFFGEGITIFGDRLIQLTWTAGRGFVYDLDTFQPLSRFSYPTEGWGLTHDGVRLIMSDGSARLYFRDPDTLEESRRITVRAGGKLVNHLNELEYIDGEVYANVLWTDRIARIDPADGRVLAWIDLGGLLSAEDRRGRRAGVLNGIAYDRDNRRLFVTGKWWPWLYEVKLVPRSNP